jgi:phosphatidate cytidylyltransferase
MEAVASLQWAVGGVFATLVTATATTGTLDRLRPGLDLTEVRLRVRSWWIMAAVFVLALAVHRTITVAFLAVIGMTAVWELARMTKTVLTSVALTATAIAYVAASMGRTDVVPAAVLGAPLAAAMLMVARGATAGFVARVGGTFMAAAAGAALAQMAGLLALPVSDTHVAGGAGLLLWLVIVTQGGDVAQFLTGKAVGVTKLAPAVSPGKTVAGALGGTAVAAALGSGLGLLLTGHTWLWGCGLGAAVAVSGVIGDLVVSAVKRDCGVKDAGALIPGHGGVLDRVDSLLLAAPLVLWVVTG